MATEETNLQNEEFDALGIDSKTIAEIRAKADSLIDEKEGIDVVYPIVIKGNPRRRDKELYVGYFREPNFKMFSKYLVASTQNQAGAMRTLARDIFIDGDKELVDKDSLFLFGLMGQLSKIIEMRNGALINL